MTSARLTSLRNLLRSQRLDALVVSFIPHIRYLTGFTGSNAICLITESDQILVTDPRYETQVRKEVKKFRILIGNGSLLEELQSVKIFTKRIRVGFQSEHLSYAIYKNLRTLFRQTRFLPALEILDSLTSVKDDKEISAIKNATKISDRVFKKILPIVKAGVRELDIAAEISYLHKSFGAESDAFEPIVASGHNSALPHARASAKKIRKGDLLILDFGCRYDGYHSDLTRTIAVGKVTKEKRRIYETVLEAQQKAIANARSGLSGKKLDQVARNVIRKAGYDKYFKHSLGHGLGLQVHELPKISPLSKDVLCEGNVITIEPGIYIPSIGGVRIEDDVLITGNGCEVLTKAEKDLIIV